MQANVFILDSEIEFLVFYANWILERSMIEWA